MAGETRVGMTALCLGIALLAGAAAAAGVFLRGDGLTSPAVSLQGELYDYAADGVYRYNAVRMVAEGVGWDAVTLFLAVPALLLTLPLVARGSFRGRLFALGILAYLFYQYLMYAVAWAFGPLFLPFVAIYAGSLVALLWIGSSIGLAGLADRFSDGFPRLGVAILCAVVALALMLMWLARILGALQHGVDGVLLGQTTLVVQALDLGLIVPAALFAGIAVWRRRPIGYLLSSALVVKAAAMGAAICAMLLVAGTVAGTLEVGPLVLFAGITVVSVVLGIRVYRSVAPAESAGA